MIAVCAFSAGWMMGARRTLFTTVSPDGKRVAYVTEGRCAEVRCQALRVANNPGRGSSKTIEALTGDGRKAGSHRWTQMELNNG